METVSYNRKFIIPDFAHGEFLVEVDVCVVEDSELVDITIDELYYPHYDLNIAPVHVSEQALQYYHDAVLNRL